MSWEWWNNDMSCKLLSIHFWGHNDMKRYRRHRFLPQVRGVQWHFHAIFWCQWRDGRTTPHAPNSKPVGAVRRTVLWINVLMLHVCICIYPYAVNKWSQNTKESKRRPQMKTWVLWKWWVGKRPRAVPGIIAICIANGRPGYHLAPTNRNHHLQTIVGNSRSVRVETKH